MEVDSPESVPTNVAEAEAEVSVPAVPPTQSLTAEVPNEIDVDPTIVAPSDHSAVEGGDPTIPTAVNGNGGIVVDGSEEALKNETTPPEDEVQAEEALPEDASEVLYINNLNEKVKLDVMKQSLKALFKQYGIVLGITAHGNIRMRGQAFVTLDSKDAAAKAVKEVQQFPLYGKPMQLAFARSESDALVKRKNPESYDQHKEQRLVRKKKSRRDNPLRRKHLVQKESARKAAEAAALQGGLTTGTTAVAAGTTTRRIVQMPDEYLPPNKILFIQNLPDETSQDALEELFKTYPNLVQVRTIPGRKNIAFVEYTDEVSSGVARDHLHNVKFGQGDNALKLKVTFAKLG